jgi:hypothetical protein
LFERDSLQAQVNYGHGIFRFCNDNFQNNDVAYDDSGTLRALSLLGEMAGYTHHWSRAFRSTATFGYVIFESQPSAGPDAYYRTCYTSLNLVWQMLRHLSVGLKVCTARRRPRGATPATCFA